MNGFFIHLSKNESARKRDVVGIFDLETSSMQPDTRSFLKSLQKDLRVVNLCDDLPQSFVLCDGEYAETAYITQLSAKSLEKRG